MNRFAMLGATLALSAFIAPAALADNDQDGKRHDHDGHKPDFAAMHAFMCKDRYAHAIGRTAYLEAKLSLSTQQQSLFDAWKGAVLSSAQSEASTCAAEARPDMRPDALARMNHMEAHLQARLAALQTELPPLTALYQSLSPEQKRAFDMGGFHHHHHGMMGHGMWMHHEGDGDHRPDGEHHPDGDGA
jgi:hypothetical protein